jgi:hypothetical protein
MRMSVPEWEGQAIDSIDRVMAHERWLDEAAMRHSTGVAREVRKHVTKLFNWAGRPRLLAASPVAGMRRPELRYAAPRAGAQMEELQGVWDGHGEMGYPFGPMVQLLILTAQRRAEIANLQRSWLHAGP